MATLNQVYKCAICGNITEVLHAGEGTLVCCGQPMHLLSEKSVEEGKEKHVPIIKNLKTKVRVRVSSKEHPMLPEHHIEFIELEVDGKVYRQQLKPGEQPRAEFCIKGDKFKARAYCNVHGLWKSD